VAFLVPAECLSTKTFSSSCFNKFGKMACCGLFLLLLLSCLLVERSMPGEKLTWSLVSSSYCIHCVKLEHKELTV